MIIETIIWILFTLFTVYLSALKTKHFMKERGFKKATKDYYVIKAKPSITKTIDDKKDYLRKKTETGEDLMTIVISTIIFIIGFIFLIYPKIPSLYAGLLAALIFSLICSWIFSKIQFTKHIYEYRFIDAFIGYLFASTFMIYIKFVTHIPIILLLLLSIGIMIITNKTINKWVGNVQSI